MPLAPADIEAIAAALAPWLVPLLRDAFVEGRSDPPERYVDAATVASLFGVERDWVYAHKEELGAFRLGTGRRARLRFDVQRVAALFERRGGGAPEPFAAPAKAARQRSSHRGTGAVVPLIAYEA